jgi:hypothetical protein
MKIYCSRWKFTRLTLSIISDGFKPRFEVKFPFIRDAPAYGSRPYRRDAALWHLRNTAQVMMYTKTTGWYYGNVRIIAAATKGRLALSLSSSVHIISFRPILDMTRTGQVQRSQLYKQRQAADLHNSGQRCQLYVTLSTTYRRCNKGVLKIVWTAVRSPVDNVSVYMYMKYAYSIWLIRCTEKYFPFWLLEIVKFNLIFNRNRL